MNIRVKRMEYRGLADELVKIEELEIECKRTGTYEVKTVISQNCVS